MRIGFIGTGTISAAVIEGLQLLPEPPEIVVSPRSESTSLALAAKFRNVSRAGSNAEVAKADIVFLGMRPAHVDEAMAGIGFDKGQIVASMVAGLGLAEIAARWPQATACRFIPLPGIARGVGPMATYPALPEMVQLLSPLGDLFVAPDEARLNFGGLSAFMSSYFELQRALIEAATGVGLSQTDARNYAVSLLGMLADTARHTPVQSFDRLVEEHETKGGLNARVRAGLADKGWFETPRAVLHAATALGYKALG